MSEKTRTFAPVIELDRHIEILLLSNDCVIVPDLGGFMAHHVDARYDEHDGMFVPPIRTLGFNPQLRLNDSLLAQSYVEAYDISYPEAVRRIEEEVNELRQYLDTEGRYELNDIGVLSLNDEGHLTFEPCEAGILTPSLYGLGSFQMPTLKARQQQQTEQTQVVEMPEEGAITIKMSWLRNIVAVAAAFVAFLMIGTPVNNSTKLSDVQQSAFISVPSHGNANANPAPTHEAQTAAVDATPAVAAEAERTVEPEAPVIESEPVATADAPAVPHFYIVMASQVSERNANAFIEQLQSKGYNEGHVLVSGSKKIRRVVYGSFATEEEATAALRQLRKDSRLFRETWVMEIK